MGIQRNRVYSWYIRELCINVSTETRERCAVESTCDPASIWSTRDHIWYFYQRHVVFILTSRSLLLSLPFRFFLFPSDMADRRSKSGGKDSIRMVVSRPQEEQQSSSAPTRRHVTLRADSSRRLQQIVSYSPSEDLVPDDDTLPSLLEVMDDEDEDEAIDDLADAMENKFFGSKDQVVPEKSTGPVRMTSIVYLYPVVNSFRFALSKTGCHFARNMSMNSCHWTALVMFRSLQLALAVASIRLLLSARTALVVSCTVRSAHSKLIVYSRFIDFG
jgi:hypothetical protein